MYRKTCPTGFEAACEASKVSTSTVLSAICICCFHSFQSSQRANHSCQITIYAWKCAILDLLTKVFFFSLRHCRRNFKSVNLHLCILLLSSPPHYPIYFSVSPLRRLLIMECFHCRSTQIYHRMTPCWQLQSAAKRDSSKKEFPPRTHQHRLGELPFGVCREVLLKEAGLK